MSNNSSILRSAVKEGECRLQPLKEHELFGLPKSSSKKGTFIRPTTDRPLMQPIKVKDLFPSEYKKPVVLSARKSSKSFIHGLSKSEGKLNKTQDFDGEPGRLLNMKALMKSWEKSQTVKPVRFSSNRPSDVRSQNVRRKLYAPSPKVKPENNRKSVMPSKLHSEKKMAHSMPMKPQVRKSLKPENSKPVRKSLLLPPNSIAKQHVIRSKNQTTVQELSVINSDPEDQNEENEKEEVRVPSNSENTSTERTEKTNEESLARRVQRPTVIMGISSKMRNIQQLELKDSNKCKAPRIPLQELSLSASPCLNLDIDSRSLEELLDDDLEPCEIDSCDPGSETDVKTLPLTSESINPRLLFGTDQTVLSWMHQQVKNTVLSLEEQLETITKQLASKRLVLKTLESAMSSNDKMKETNSSNEKQIEESNTKPQSELSTPVQQITITSDTIVQRELNEKEKDSLELETFESGEDENRDVKNDDDKENKENVGECKKPVRRSLRLLRKLSNTPKSADDSFAKLEEELNIAVKSKENSGKQKGSRSAKRFTFEGRKSLCEYMALKSAVSFLQTPNAKGFPFPSVENDTPSQSRSTKRYLSRKILSELDDLYTNSPMK